MTRTSGPARNGAEALANHQQFLRTGPLTQQPIFGRFYTVAELVLVKLPENFAKFPELGFTVGSVSQTFQQLCYGNLPSHLEGLRYWQCVASFEKDYNAAMEDV